MSHSEFENWNPMADDYTSEQFNSYNDTSNRQIDFKSLYIKSIPVDLTEDSFLSLLTEGGKKIKKYRLFPPRPNFFHSCGLVSYHNERDALEVKARLNGRPPLYLKVEYAHNNLENKALTVVVTGDKRIAFQNSESVNNPRECSYSPDLPDLIPYLCLFCNEKGMFFCGKCQQTYCSINCQRRDWPKHKPLCKSKSTISKQNIFTNDSSYTSEGSISDNDKKMKNDLSIKQVQDSLSKCQGQNVTSAEPRVCHTSSYKPCMPLNNSDKRIQKKFLKANELQEQELSLNNKYKLSVCKACSPSNFWIHLDGTKKVLLQMEKEMTSMVQKIPTKFVVDDVCCTFENGKFMRVRILEVTPHTSTVQLIDYGGTSVLLNNLLYFLPPVFKNYHVQAIGCNLVDGVSTSKVSWIDEEISSFEDLTKNKIFIGHVYGFDENVYNISLTNEEGVGLYFILKDLYTFSQSNSPLTPIPSALDDLRKGTEVTVRAVYFEEDKFWGYLMNDSHTKLLKELKNCLQKVDTEDISLTCEEGDIAVGFSPNLNLFARCIILKRLRNAFIVRYIDYGRTEKITKLHSISPRLLKKSYVICCEKPASLSILDMKLAFETVCSLTVETIKNKSVELSFKYRNKPIIICCYPWYHGTMISPVTNSHLSESPSESSKLLGPKSNIKDYQSPKKNIYLSSKSLSLKSEMPHKSVITKDLISDKVLDAALKYDVKIVWMKDATEIYVQLIDDDNAIRKLLSNINNYCHSASFSQHSPIVDEIVCCKFTDDVWYRAHVTGKNKEKFRVLFIDYGNEAEVSASNIKPLPKKFAIPKLSFCVSLYEIKNEDVNKEILEKFFGEILSMELKNGKRIPAEVMLYLKGKPLSELLGEKKNHSKTLLKFQELPISISKVVICYAQADKIYVHQQKDLNHLLSLQTKLNSSVKTDVSKLEIDMVYSCLSGDGQWYRGLVKEIFSKSVRVNYIDFGNDEEILINNLKELSDDLFFHPVYCVPIIAQNLELSKVNPETVFSMEVISKKDGVQLVKVLNHSQNTNNQKISALRRLSLEEGVNEVKLSFFENDTFYCHLKNHFSDFDLLAQNLKDPKLKPLHQAPTQNDLVCAKSNDGCWYRASVQNIYDKDLKFKVLFIDYGNCEDVTFENIRHLPEDLFNFPMFCVPVKIINIEKAKNILNINSTLSVKTVGFSKDNVQLVELLLPCNTVLPKLNSLKKQLLPTDKEVDVSLCHVEGDMFFVHIASSNKLLATLEAGLIKASEFKDLFNLPEIGDIICAKFNDGIWYRGSVQEVFSDQKSCKICFIDYGNCEVISLENMKFLPTSLCTFPVLSVPVKFKNGEKLQEKIDAKVCVFSVRVIESSDATVVVDIAIPEEDIQPSFIGSEILPELPVEVMISHQEDGVIYVQRISNVEKLQEMMLDLQNPIFFKELSHNPKLGELCNVKYEDGQFYRGIIKKHCSENKYKVFFVDYGNFDIVESENILSIPPKYSLVPGLCSAIKFNELDNVNVLNSNPIFTIKYTGISNDNVHVVKLCLPINKVLISSMAQSNLDEVAQDITFLSFDGEFYFLTKCSDFVEINEMNSMLKKFEGEEFSGIPTIDEVLIVKCQNHSNCRGCIKAVDETLKTCKVFLIDHGTTEDVLFSNIFYMPEKLGGFPIFSIKVTVKDSILKAGSDQFQEQYNATVIGKTTDDVPIIHIFKRYMLSSLTQQKLPLKELRDVKFYHKDGDIFFLQDLSNNPLVCEIQAEVKRQSSSDPLSRIPIIGELLCARSQADGSWYRCCVEEMVSCDEYRIRFIDYGNEEIVMLKDLRPFVGELTMYPSFAIPVRIIDSECTKSTVQIEEVYSVIAEKSENTIQLVKLMPQHDSSVCIPVAVISEIGDDTKSESKEMSHNSDMENCEIKELSRSCKSSPKVKYLYSTSDNVHFPDGELDIIIYSVDESCSLFCAPFNPDAIKANLALTSEITQYCDNLENPSCDGGFSPELDELVLAKYDADNQWYRAVIVDNSHPFYGVIFIDYGNAETVSINCIRKMEKVFMSLPVQTHLCSITGFTFDDNSLPSIIAELGSFVVFVNPKPLRAHVSSNAEAKFVNIPEITEHLLKKKLVAALKS